MFFRVSLRSFICLCSVAMFAACGDDESVTNASPLSSTTSSSDAVLPESSSEASPSTGSSSSEATTALFCKTETEDKCEYGSLTDDRDGKTYKTVKIGDQWWMAQNLDYTDGSEPHPIHGPIWTSINMAVDSVRIGRLYVWDTAIEVCPDGWHLPNNDEWSVLVDLAGGWDVAGKVLKAQTGWSVEAASNGIDAVGFSALPAGYKMPNMIPYSAMNGGFWSATESEQTEAYVVSLFDLIDVNRVANGSREKTSGYSVRCIKN
ncbi:MAG: hypothetical protein IKS96_10985 [Fibrobacter sp.]|nr:hypothetical protein [Fibrobacter sp.]